MPTIEDEATVWGNNANLNSSPSGWGRKAMLKYGPKPCKLRFSPNQTWRSHKERITLKSGRRKQLGWVDPEWQGSILLIIPVGKRAQRGLFPGLGCFQQFKRHLQVAETKCFVPRKSKAHAKNCGLCGHFGLYRDDWSPALSPGKAERMGRRQGDSPFIEAFTRLVLISIRCWRRLLRGASQGL